MPDVVQHRAMLARFDRHEFMRWLDANQEDFLDAISQTPRSISEWSADFARAVKSGGAELGKDRGFSGVFGDSEEGMGLVDPGDDFEDEGF